MSNENLVSLGDRTTEEQREIAKNGGKASGVARRRKRDMRTAIRAILDGKHNDKTGVEAMAAALFERALQGDPRAVELVLKLAGQSAVAFPFPEITRAKDSPLITAAILKAVAVGSLPPDDVTKLSSLLTAHVRR